MSVKTPWLQRYRWLVLAHLLACVCLLPQCQMSDTQAPREEKFVTVRLHDSLKRYDSVEIVILAAGDSNQVVGKIWNGALTDPAKVPSFRLADGENRDLSVRVRGFDSNGHLTLNLLISKQIGGQVVADLPVPPVVAVIPPKDATKPVIPPDTVKPPVIIPPDTVKPPVIIPPDTTKPSDPDDEKPRLTHMLVYPGAMYPAFDSAVYDYRVNVLYAESSVTFTTQVNRSKTSVVIGSDTLPDGKPSQPLALDVGENDFTVRVIARKLETVYNVKVFRPQAPVDTTHNPNEPYKDWKHRGVVFVNLKTMGMNRSWAETDFPLLLRLTQANFDFSSATPADRDIRFTKMDGTTILPFEMARWEPDKKRAEIWIKMDTLRAADDSAKFYMYWGNPAAQGLSAPAKVFDPRDRYTAVYHLGEQGNGTDEEYPDATGRYHGQGGSGNGENVPQRVEGVVGYAQDFHPAETVAGQSYQAAIGLPSGMDPGPQAWTFQAWIKRTGNTSSPAILFNKSDRWAASDQRFEFYMNPPSGQLFVKREGNDAASNVYIPSQTFVHLDVVYSGSKLEIFVDGFSRETHDWTQGGWPDAECTLGAKYPDGSQYGFEGMMDEVWLSSKARSPMWIRMSFETQRQGSTIVTLRR